MKTIRTILAAVAVTAAGATASAAVEVATFDVTDGRFAVFGDAEQAAADIGRILGQIQMGENPSGEVAEAVITLSGRYGGTLDPNVEPAVAKDYTFTLGASYQVDIDDGGASDSVAGSIDVPDLRLDQAFGLFGATLAALPAPFDMFASNLVAQFIAGDGTEQQNLPGLFTRVTHGATGGLPANAIGGTFDIYIGTFQERMFNGNDLNDVGPIEGAFDITASIAEPSEVPLPAGLPLLAAGLGAFGWVARRKARA
ncbi:VPLPA-CTERM sorting domain-containing protein [Jannaschia sp. LMIT008]|uniref:VPLPA-CTERM sorting domain-containing protein n=1 Tax=Jannaschia maritima TaxID=3032585 RepID=UPI002810C73B|nr:VPLPA-CTERM sorting domain-containing protein [Jannaschia sp. LMIT008]